MAKKKSEKNVGPWDVLALISGMIPGVSALSLGVARSTVQRLLGFWLMWHIYGGRSGLLGAGVMAESTMYRQVNEFRRVFGQDVDVWGADVAARLLSSEGVSDEQG